MFVKLTSRLKNGKLYSGAYIVQGYRDKLSKKVKHRYLLNISSLPLSSVLAIKQILANGVDNHSPINLDNLEVLATKEFGSVKVFQSIFDKYFKSIIGSTYYNAIQAITINKILDNKSKNSLHLWTQDVDFGFQIKNKNIWYKSLDYLAENHEGIENSLFKKHGSKEANLYLYDITSTYFEGQGAENLCRYGYSRDHRSDRVQVNIGLVTNDSSIPLCIKTFPGNTPDSKTLSEQVEDLKSRFNIKNVITVFDRGMKTKMNLEKLESEGYEYITALSARELKKKASEHKEIQLGLFDKKDLAEFVIDEKKYILCHSPIKFEKDKRVREKLLDKTEADLKKINSLKKKQTDKTVYEKVSKVLNKYKTKRYIEYSVKNGKVIYSRNEEKIKDEGNYDGFYMIHTNKIDITAAKAQEKYKDLQIVERAFNSLKNHLEIRPVRHYTEKRIKGHIVSCFLSYYMLARFKEECKEYLEKESLDELITTLRMIRKVYVKVEMIILERITKMNEKQKELLEKFKIKVDVVPKAKKV